MVFIVTMITIHYMMNTYYMPDSVLHSIPKLHSLIFFFKLSSYEVGIICFTDEETTVREFKYLAQDCKTSQ